MALTSYTIDDASPQVAYSPFADTFVAPDLSAGWNPYYSESGFAASPGDQGEGETQHITALDGAGLELQFNGTVSNCTEDAQCSP